MGKLCLFLMTQFILRFVRRTFYQILCVIVLNEFRAQTFLFFKEYFCCMYKVELLSLPWRGSGLFIIPQPPIKLFF